MTQGSAADRDAPDWRRYLGAVLRYRWAVAAVIAAGTLAGLLAARSVEPVYTARAVLWIEGPAAPAPDAVPAAPVVRAEGWAELLRAHAVLDTVVRDLGLYLTTPARAAPGPALAAFDVQPPVQAGSYRLHVDRARTRYVLTDADGAELDTGTAGDSIGRDLGFRWAPDAALLPAGEALSFTVTAPHDAARALAGKIAVRLEPAGNFLRVQFTDADPRRAATIVNAVAERGAAVAAALKRQKLEELTAILGDRHQAAEAALRDAEAALADFAVRNVDAMRAGAPPIPGGEADSYGTPVRALEQRAALEAIQADAAALKDALGGPGTPPRPEALALIPAVRDFAPLQTALEEIMDREAEMRALRSRYTEASAPVRQLQAEIDSLTRRSLPALGSQLLTELRGRAAVLSVRVDLALSAYRRVPPLALERARLERSVAAADEMFSTVRRRYSAARLGLLSSLPDIRVLDRAAPPARPTANYAGLIVVLSAVASTGVAVAGAAVADRLNHTVRDPEQVTAAMGLTILGAVPRAETPDARSEVAAASVLEALRGIRARLLHTHGMDGPLVLTVTSPGVGDGKSFVSVNLALSFAYAGFETLLIDGDVRRGVQHRVLGLDGVPGLTDVLRGDATAADAIQRTDYAGLSLMPAGRRMYQAPELLMSPRLAGLLDDLRERHGVIIVDSPPLVVGVDPVALGTATQNLLLVLRSGATELSLAASQLDALDALPVRTIGTVLNDVRRHDRFQDYTYDLSGYPLPDDAARRPRVLGGRT